MIRGPQRGGLRRPNRLSARRLVGAAAGLAMDRGAPMGRPGARSPVRSSPSTSSTRGRPLRGSSAQYSSPTTGRGTRFYHLLTGHYPGPGWTHSLEQTLLGRLQAPQPVKPVQATAAVPACQTALDKRRTTLQYQLASWLPAAAGGCSTAPFNSSCCAGQGRGGTTGLLEYQGRRPSRTEGRRPTPDSGGSRSSASAVAAAVKP